MAEKKKEPTVEERNMAIWNAVEETDPNQTKRVDYGRKFTAIDAYYQIKQATRVFGPMGIGWGYTVELDREYSNAIIADLSLWYRSNGSRSEPIRVFGTSPLSGKISQDIDAPKKAITDALTKALSYLGFSADVFLGKFDDNKYVAALNEKYNGNGEEKQSKTSKKPKNSNGKTEQWEKNRKLIWAKAIGLWGKDDAKRELEEHCKGTGWKLSELTEYQQEVIITSLADMEKKGGN